jgi:hypothetical protein
MSHLVSDSALDWWARGFTAAQIARILAEKTGRRFTVKGIEGAVFWARKQGDMRAARRNKRREGA